MTYRDFYFATIGKRIVSKLTGNEVNRTKFYFDARPEMITDLIIGTCHDYELHTKDSYKHGIISQRVNGLLTEE